MSVNDVVHQNYLPRTFSVSKDLEGVTRHEEYPATKHGVKSYYKSARNFAKSFLNDVACSMGENVDFYVSRRKASVIRKHTSGNVNLFDLGLFEMYWFNGNFSINLFVAVWMISILPVLGFSGALLDENSTFSIFVMVSIITMWFLTLPAFVFAGFRSVRKFVRDTGYLPDVFNEINEKGTQLAAFTADAVYFSKYDAELNRMKYERFAIEDVSFVRKKDTESGPMIEAVGYDRMCLFRISDHKAPDGVDLVQELNERIVSARRKIGCRPDAN